MGFMNVVCFKCKEKEYDVTPEFSRMFAAVHQHGSENTNVQMYWISESEKPKSIFEKLLQVIKGK